MPIHSIEPRRNNNFGALRLLFAVLVVVSHSPELIDGNRSRELLTRAFGTLSFGELAVDGFFIVSGYLITKSFDQEPSATPYLRKRIARIYPGYLVNFALCFFVLSPFVGAQYDAFLPASIGRAALQVARLLPPNIPGAFADLPYPALNGSAYTIAYEFRCYLVVLMVGLFGRRLPFGRWTLLALVITASALDVSGVFSSFSFQGSNILGDLQKTLHFGSAFGAGSLFYMTRSMIPMKKELAVIALFSLILAMFWRLSAQPAVLLFGSYLIFWIAFEAPALIIGRPGAQIDISYGLYLYAWPIQNTLILFDRSIGPTMLCTLTLIGAGLAGCASWFLIEKPILHRAGSRVRTVARESSPAVTLRVVHPSSGGQENRIC